MPRSTFSTWGRGPKVLPEPSEFQSTLLKDTTLGQRAAWSIGLIYGDKSFLWQHRQVLVIGDADDGAGQGTLLI